jgi:hypothetical protein
MVIGIVYVIIGHVYSKLPMVMYIMYICIYMYVYMYMYINF